MKAYQGILAVASGLFALNCQSTPEEVDPVSEVESLMYRSNTAVDIAWWTHDEQGGADDVYTDFTTQEYESPDTDGVFVDLPDCLSGDTFTVEFNGIASGDWQYRASLRAHVTHGEIESDIHGAQIYVTPPTHPGAIVPVHISGVFTAPQTGGPCRVTIRGKTFAGTMSLFGGASLVVKRHR